MKRSPDWEEKLGAYFAEHRDAAFKYGTLDCALFAAGAVKVMTGEDPARGFRGKYRSAATSLRAIKRAGFENLAAVMDAKFEQIPPAYAQRGDLIMDGSDSLGVCFGRDGVFVGEEDGEAGLVQLPLSSWTRAWRVPFQS